MTIMVSCTLDGDSVILLGISGKQFSGKSTLANALSNWFSQRGYNPCKMALADPLKDMVKRGLGRADREAWQVFGTEVVRNGCLQYFGNSDFWVKLYLSMVQDAVAGGKYNVILCDDIRFPDELRGLRQKGFRVIRLDATELTRRERGQSTGKAYLPGHASELALDNTPLQEYDLVVQSDVYSPTQLTEKVTNLLSLVA